MKTRKIPVSKKKPWQIKGSKEAKEHMKKARESRNKQSKAA